MIKRLCDKCGKEIGNKEAFIKIYAKIYGPNGNEHSQECLDLCGVCLWKFREWLKGDSPIQEIVKEEVE